MPSISGSEAPVCGSGWSMFCDSGASSDDSDSSRVLRLCRVLVLIASYTGAPIATPSWTQRRPARVVASGASASSRLVQPRPGRGLEGSCLRPRRGGRKGGHLDMSRVGGSRAHVESHLSHCIYAGQSVAGGFPVCATHTPRVDMSRFCPPLNGSEVASATRAPPPAPVEFDADALGPRQLRGRCG